MRIIGSIALLAAVTLVWGGQADAGPPERFDVDIFTITPDEEHGLAAFVNITRDDFCDWAGAGFEGPAPVGALIPVMVNEVGPGALVASFQSATVVDIELWQLDADVPPFVDPCVDTDEQEAPWATGQATWMANDNDLDVSLTRTNSFGERVTARVVDGDGGTWRYTAVFRGLIDRDGEFRAAVEHSVLKPVGR